MSNQEIHRLKETNKKLLEENELYKKKLHYYHLLMNTLPDHIYFKDKESRFTAVSRSMADDFFGEINTEKMIGLNDFDILDKEHAEQAFADEQKIINSEEQGFINKEEKEVYPNGEVRWASSTKQPMYDEDGNVIGIFGLSHNITNIKNLMAEIEKLSERDQLTGLYNKRMFNSFFSKEWLVARRNQWDLSILMIDIDFFKQYNDGYGHLNGDTCLSNIAKAVQKIPCRPGDYSCRFGGEEFVVILQNTNSTGAVHMAERIMNHIEELKIPHKDSSVSEHVTVSIGISTISLQLRKILSNQNQLLEYADKALYSAKKSGRNKYCVKNVSPSFTDSPCDA